MNHLQPQNGKPGGPLIAMVAGGAIMGLSGWVSLLYGAYQLGKGNKSKALAGLGGAVVSIIAVRAVAKAGMQAQKQELAVITKTAEGAAT